MNEPTKQIFFKKKPEKKLNGGNPEKFFFLPFFSTVQMRDTEREREYKYKKWERQTHTHTYIHTYFSLGYIYKFNVWCTHTHWVFISSKQKKKIVI